MNILRLPPYINAFTCNWYVVYAYHFPLNVHVNDTYRIRITLSIDPDWDGTATEQTDVHLFFYSSISLFKGAIFIINLRTYY